MAPLAGVSVLVAGAGLAGLAAARDLVALGAEVVVVEARDRVGGRVHTLRDGFAGGQHAETGADLIESSHSETKRLTEGLGLTLVPILRGGFSYVRPDPRGRPRMLTTGAARAWSHLARSLEPAVEQYRLAERRWDSPIAAALGRRSVAQWLDDVGADDDLRATALSLRGFFAADPDELSLLALVDQFASDEDPGAARLHRIAGGNDRLASALAKALGGRVRLDTELVAVSHRGQRVRASLKHGRQTAQLQCDYLIFAVPAPLLRRVPIMPALPAQQHEAIARLRYGRTTESLLQFSNRFWRAPGRLRAFGSPLPLGAVWDGNEEQRGRPGILSLLAAGSASDATMETITKEGPAALVRSLEWLGSRRAELLAARYVQWEADPWARGGYAVFDPNFDPLQRSWLARPFGRLFFAGEHTSQAWQGYMNGAIESGRRAAAEVAATHRMATP